MILSLQNFETVLVLRGDPRPLSGVPLPPPELQAQGLGGTADLTRNRRDRRPLRFMILPMLLHQPDCPLPNLRRKSIPFRHAPILSRLGVSGNPGAIQSVFPSYDLSMPKLF